jgi:molecular chaperone DnaK (HSP70)
MPIPLSVFLKATGQATLNLLNSVLPKVGGPDWWKTCVVSKLSYQQQQRVSRGEIVKLEDLDIAAAMRIVDKNWYEIAEQAGFPTDAKTLVHEVSDIRHRLAHEGATKEMSNDDLFRDLDTLKRYLTMLKADSDLILRIDGERKEVLSKMARNDSLTPETSQITPPLTPSAPSNQAPAQTITKPKDPLPSRRGVPLSFLGTEAGSNKDILDLLAKRTYVGIDFGTSTTTASRVILDQETGVLSTEPIPIKQYDETGTCIEDHLVPSCIAWTGNSLLVGQGAARLKTEYEHGRNIWFSFKMRLGIDLGPQYYRSELSSGKGQQVIEKPQHAAAVFFRYLREQVESFVAARKLPSDIVYSVSVPAAFEANQRKDLVDALESAAISVAAHGIVDEPNAAFISYLLDTLRLGSGIADSMKTQKRNVLVFDFGAGTCDISVLQVYCGEEQFISKNLAISQFHALGGDNIDRQIVREILWPQMIAESKPTADFTSAELDNAIIPRLQQTAEDMKRQCCRIIANNWDGQNIKPFLSAERKLVGNPIPTFNVHGCPLTLSSPTMTFREFAKIMEPFLDPRGATAGVLNREDDVGSIFEPLQNALVKANITADDLNMILYIGGSSLNPFVQHAIAARYGRFVECILPGDTRTPVSRGAAIHAFMTAGLHCEVIRPITSEPIYVVTAGGGLHELLPAGTEMPSEPTFVSELIVQNNRQRKIELPICVSNEDKLLGIVEIPAPGGHPFKQGVTITLTCLLDENKLLTIQAKAATMMVTGKLLNPLSNEALTPEETRMLLARQAVNLSALENQGRPSVSAMLAYAYASMEAKHHLQAAEAFEAVERLDASRDFATNICFCYARACKARASSKWAQIAYQRKPSPIAAFNLALDKKAQNDINGFEQLMEEAIAMDPAQPCVLEMYGHHLKNQGSAKGIAMLEIAVDKFSEAFEKQNLDIDDFPRLSRAAATLGRREIVQRVERRRKDLGKQNRIYSESNLAVSTRSSSDKAMET